MATHVIRPISPVGYREGERYRTRPLAAAQTFKAGAPIIATTGADTFQVAGTNPATLVGFATAGAADYAWKYNTIGNVAPAVPVALADQEFRGSIASASSGTPTVIANVSAIIGTTYGLVVDADTGYWVLSSNPANKIVKVTGVDEQVQDGDGNIPVRFVVVPAARDVIA